FRSGQAKLMQPADVGAHGRSPVAGWGRAPGGALLQDHRAAAAYFAVPDRVGTSLCIAIWGNRPLIDSPADARGTCASVLIQQGARLEPANATPGVLRFRRHRDHGGNHWPQPADAVRRRAL